MILEQPKTGSWRNMYLTDPPCTIIWFIVSWLGGGPLEKRFLSKGDVSNASEVTLGDLIDASVGEHVAAKLCHDEMGNWRQEISLSEAIERYQARWGEHEYPTPHFNCSIDWNGGTRS